jgi:Protein of unknown function (DUF3108)
MASCLMRLSFALSLLAMFAPAWPQAEVRAVQSVYHLYYGKIKLGDVTEKFTIRDGQYFIESVARPVLSWLLPTLSATSEGTVTAQGLRPRRYEQRLSNKPDKTISADFDWPNNTLHLKSKDKHEQHELKGATFDNLSLKYQFLFTPPNGDGSVYLTTGKKLYQYHYKVLNDEVVTTPLGKMNAMHVAKIAAADEAKFDLWLGKDKHFLPVKVLAEDDDKRIEQLLVSMTIE